MIYTSYFGNLENLLKSGFKKSDLVRISYYDCRWCSGLKSEKKLFVNVNRLWELKSGVINWKEFSLEYYNKLYDLEWYWLNYEFLDLYDEKVLLCFEKNYRECHRSLLGKFMNWYFGKVVVKEF